MYACPWALQELRNYLYGVADLTIYTDHQSLIHSISEKNPNTKLKRWKKFIAEFGAEIKYEPGFQNVVADALSRHQVNNTTIHSIVSSPTEFIKSVNFPLNQFKTQIELRKSNTDKVESRTTFNNHEYHKIKFKTRDKLIESHELAISHNHVNAILSSMETFAFIEEILFNTFPNEKFVYTPTKVMDVTDLTEQLDIVEKIYDRAHRNAINNYEEAKRTHYWPNMKKDFQKWVKHCEICKTQKYERNPTK